MSARPNEAEVRRLLAATASSPVAGSGLTISHPESFEGHRQALDELRELAVPLAEAWLGAMEACREHCQGCDKRRGAITEEMWGCSRCKTTIYKPEALKAANEVLRQLRDPEWLSQALNEGDGVYRP